MLKHLNMTTPKQRKKWREKQSTYYKNNREKWNKYQRDYKRKRYSEDSEYRETHNSYIASYNKKRYAEDPEYRERMKAYWREAYRKSFGSILQDPKNAKLTVNRHNTKRGALWHHRISWVNICPMILDKELYKIK
jgi:hypothetical protein